MSDASEKSLLRHQLFRFRWLLWCFLPSLVLIWVLLLLVAVLPEHWIQRMNSSLPHWELWGVGGFLFLPVFLSFFINGIIVFKALGERFRLSPLPRVVITTAVFLFVFPALDRLLGSPFKHLVRWFRPSVDWATASSEATFETLIKSGLVLSAQWLSWVAMLAFFPLILILVLALFKSPHHQQPETLS